MGLYVMLIVNSQCWEAESLSGVGGKHVDGGLISVGADLSCVTVQPLM